MSRLIDAEQMEKHIMESKVFNQYFKELAQSLIWGENTIESEPVKHGRAILEHKHSWIKLEDGEIDNFAVSSGYHNGALCEICGYSFCEHCYPQGYKDESCKDHFICSDCNKDIAENDAYCKHCGAKMDKEESK